MEERFFARQSENLGLHQQRSLREARRPEIWTHRLGKLGSHIWLFFPASALLSPCGPHHGLQHAQEHETAGLNKSGGF